MAKKKYYKVVSKDLKSSCVDSVFLHTHAIQYLTHQFVSSVNQTPLYVFSSLVSAINYARMNQNFLVYECKIKGVCRYTPLFQLAHYDKIDQLGKIIQNKKSIKHFLQSYRDLLMLTYILPDTVAVKQVKLLQCVFDVDSCKNHLIMEENNV